MFRPAVIPHRLKENFHNKRCCIDVRNGKVHAMKINTNNRNWHNKIDLQQAIVAVNPKTRRENRLVFRQKEPFHMLSFGCGADTKYWGRYVCRVVGSSLSGTTAFHLEYVDDGQLDQCLPVGERNTSRSYLERQWDKAFAVAGTVNIYEPATMTLPPCSTFPHGKEYSPDVWCPVSGMFIEIKGPPPTEEEFEKCRLTRLLGFKIQMFRGAPDGFDCYEWDADGERSLRTYASYYRYLHPKKSRKRRRLYNVGTL